MTGRPLPSALDLPTPQYSGWACVWCGASLQNGAVSAGRAEGRMGAHDMSIEVFSCLACVNPETPAPDAEPQGDGRDDGRMPSGGEERPSR